MNINNTNSNFQDFSKCNYDKHWSYSNFFRYLSTCEQLNKLCNGSVIIEIGAGDSPLSKMMVDNYSRKDLKFLKYDVDAKKYSNDCDIIIQDITDNYFYFPNNVDCVIFEEVIEHLTIMDGINIIKKISDCLANEGLLLLSTPTPPFNGKYEELVWPDCHNHEFKKNHIYNALNKYFKVNMQVGWSLEERELNNLLMNDSFIQKVYCNLKGKLSDGFIRALIPYLVDTENSRQVLFICKKRREAM